MKLVFRKAKEKTSSPLWKVGIGILSHLDFMKIIYSLLHQDLLKRFPISCLFLQLYGIINPFTAGDPYVGRG